MLHFPHEVKKVNITKITKTKVIAINRKVGMLYDTEFGLTDRESNLDYALMAKTPDEIAYRIIYGHPFIDANKRTAFIVYIMLTELIDENEVIKKYDGWLKVLSKF